MTPSRKGSARSRRADGHDATIDWLLEAEQPSVRYRTLTELLGRTATDTDVRAAKREILERGWAAEILDRRHPGAGWNDSDSQYRPKYLSTNWMMLVLADLGLTRAEPKVRDACEFWMKGFAAKGGGLGGNSVGTPHYCVAANMARALIRFGYSNDVRVRRTVDWLVEQASPKGGWSCWGTGRNLDSWEALSVFAAYPRSKWTSEIERVVSQGAEFFLERELYRQGAHYDPWFRFHYPAHYYYDLLVGLDFMTALGYGGDPRMEFALNFLRSRQRRDGTWNLDAVHPDLEGAPARWYAAHPSVRPVPFALEKVGRPSKMITLTALRVLSAVEQGSPAGEGRP
ncbi:MAG TPA: prenyltransferase/squalene oxidase repeat-containing protein [Thermoplasmata archaeon]|nr:prenyltransferase/squalene oxidase repeat-containing protein [Thermoplasmata archaeon]